MRLGEFLRRRREAADPAACGLPPRSRRRTPGLRREEVAERASISTVYYERLERGRGALPSASVLASVAGVLQLSAAEQEYLYRLAGHAAPPHRREREGVDAGLQYLLEALDDSTPASITDHFNDVLAQNWLNRELLGDVVDLPGWQPNLTWRWFAQPGWRDLLEPREQHTQTGLAYVADLRAVLEQHEPDPRAVAMLDDLRACCEEFGELWEQHTVMARHCADKVITHPQVGALHLECSVITSVTSSQRLYVLKPAPGTPSRQRLDQVLSGRTLIPSQPVRG
ncbi:helix-turn-helix transcriptional regulator [Kineosporia succinea]